MRGEHIAEAIAGPFGFEPARIGGGGVGFSSAAECSVSRKRTMLKDEAAPG